MKTPILFRFAVIAGLAVALLVPIALIQGKIHERRTRAADTERQFAAETSGPQSLAGPMIALTCEEVVTEERQVMRAGKAETIAEKKVVACPTGYFTPRTLRVTGHVPVEARHRGIYPIRLYNAALALSGELEWPRPATPNGANPRTWKRAYLVTAVRDARGIKEATSSVAPLMREGDGGFDARYAIKEDLGDFTSRAPGTPIAFDYKVRLQGTSRLEIAPIGDTTEVRITSNWPHPSFSGAWMPDERDITREGFLATWRTSHLATGGQATWEKLAQQGKLTETPMVAGVVYFDPVNVYALAYRATEYGFLFVLFTFAAIAIAEAVAGIKLHPIQYALVGFALAVFFLLLIALSEHVKFDLAYLSASLACISLITFYLRHPLGSLRRTALFGAFAATLYGALFVLLKSEDHALLMGSLLIFGALAVAMVATRRLDWNAVSARLAGPARKAEVGPMPT